MGCKMSQKLSIDGLSGLKTHLNLIKISYKTLMKIVTKDIFLKMLFNILEYYNNLPFSLKRTKIEKDEKLVTNLCDKKKVCFTYERFQTSTKSWIIIEKMHSH